MSNHKTPVTALEKAGLEAHGLGRYIGKPSQLADVFRQGVAWALANTPQPPAQRAPTKCWKCGDADPAFTDICQVPACGMREGAQ